ncbi:DUF397 domain-containing protein [Streptomyces luteireticuli]|uniref:DUF397 domain-containing protein n=1 Tax=Streptomyces luteireticuli TaxID=173858 RepID=UPI0035564681
MVLVRSGRQGHGTVNAPEPPDTSLDLPHAEWVKSSYSQGNGGQCIEWAPAFVSIGVIPVRDSKRPDGPVLTASAPAWSSFVAAVGDAER